MNVTQSFQSISTLGEYCHDRYGCSLSAKKLNRLIIEYSIDDPVDTEMWLKIRLMNLFCFEPGCLQPPPIRLFVLLHMNWRPGAIIIPPLSCRQRSGGLRTDRRRAGRQPGLSDELFDGVIGRIPQHRNENC